jgi:hypothetical protein
MAGNYISIYFSDENYQKLKSLIQQKRVSKFVNKAVEKELGKEGKEQLKQQLIKDYQDQAKNKKLQGELSSFETAQFEDE